MFVCDTVPFEFLHRNNVSGEIILLRPRLFSNPVSARRYSNSSIVLLPDKINIIQAVIFSQALFSEIRFRLRISIVFGVIFIIKFPFYILTCGCVDFWLKPLYQAETFLLFSSFAVLRFSLHYLKAGTLSMV